VSWNLKLFLKKWRESTFDTLVDERTNSIHTVHDKAFSTL